MKLKALTILLFLALFGQVVYCDYDDDEDAYGGGGGDDDEGGGYGDEEDEGSPPPPAGDATELTSLEEFQAFIDNNDASVVAAFTTKEMPDPKAVKPEEWDDEDDGEWEPETIPNPALTAFNEITAELYGYRWAYTVADEVKEKLKAKSDSLFLYKSPRFVSKDHGDRPRERFPSSTLSQSGVANFLAAKSQPLVGLFSSDTKDRYVGKWDASGGKKPAVCVIFMNLDWEKNGKGVQYVLKRARKVAQLHKGKLSFAIASLSDMKYDMEDFGLTSTKPNVDVLMGIMERSSGKDTYYSSDAEAFSEKALSAFADAFLAGELTPHVKPDPPPAADDEDEDGSEGEDEGEDGEDEDKEEM